MFLPARRTSCHVFGNCREEAGGRLAVQLGVHEGRQTGLARLTSFCKGSFVKHRF